MPNTTYRNIAMNEVLENGNDIDEDGDWSDSGEYPPLQPLKSAFVELDHTAARI
jgi:hypothetical protein